MISHLLFIPCKAECVAQKHSHFFEKKIIQHFNCSSITKYVKSYLIIAIQYPSIIILLFYIYKYIIHLSILKFTVNYLSIQLLSIGNNLVLPTGLMIIGDREKEISKFIIYHLFVIYHLFIYKSIYIYLILQFPQLV